MFRCFGNCILLFLLVFGVSSVLAQDGFRKKTDVAVADSLGDLLKDAWVGGFNSVQFSEIDLNLDGVKDLFVFDRSGNRISTFINDGISDSISYQYAPEYAQFFPDLSGWVLLRDYNCDGMMDIFASSSAGMAVYKNESVNQLQFTLQTDLLFTQRNSYVNLYVSLEDIPAIDDIDNDGDLDILTFSILGSRVEYHKNLSMEKYGTCDSLDFELRNNCWGFFSEDNASNNVQLLDTCEFNVVNPEKRRLGNKHAGSTLFTLDVDGNDTKDLVLGDIAFDNLVLLYNGDTSSNLTQSSMVDQDSLFPQNHSNTVPVGLNVFPAAFYIDVNNDSVKDLLVSTNCTRGCSNTNNVWLYRNDGLSNNPSFNLRTTSFLQEDMIDVGESTHPVFFDYNTDGLMDIIIGNYGEFMAGGSYKPYLSLYKNVGSLSEPRFELVMHDYAGLSTMNLDVVTNQPTLGLHPTFGDLDNDGDMDMLVGDYKGNVHYFENTPDTNNEATFMLSELNYFSIDVGHNAAPQLIDLNRDMLLDLVIGNSRGNISYYENAGTAAVPSFSLVTDTLGGVRTIAPFFIDGLCVPQFVDNDGVYELYCGSQDGGIYYYGDIEGNLEGNFSLIDSALYDIWEGIGSSISLKDITNDGKLDMLVGNTAGGIAYYEGEDVSSIGGEPRSFLNVSIYPNPATTSLNIDMKENSVAGGTITITNMLGKLFYKDSIDEVKSNINLDNLRKGVYLLRLKTNKGNGVYRFVRN